MPRTSWTEDCFDRLLRNEDVDISCPKCGAAMFVNIARLRIDPRCRCSGCGKGCVIDPDILLDTFRSMVTE